MKALVIKFLAAFGLAALIALLAVEVFHQPLGQINYFDRHGFLLLVGLALFPRLTLLFSSIPFGGLFWWLGWIILPRLLVALLATVTYWQTNPLLVTLSWILALGGESGEKVLVRRQVITYRARVA